MNFGRGRAREEPEINLIPFIDVLLVIIIFLMMTTTYSRYSGLEVNLPTSDSAAVQEKSNEINVEITIAGDISIGGRPVGSQKIDDLVLALRKIPQSNPEKPPVVVINADAKASFQSVVNVMNAAQSAGLPAVTFTTQK